MPYGSKLKAGRDFDMHFVIPQTELLAPTTIELVAPWDGYIMEMSVIIQTAITTGGILTAKVGTTDVAGLSITVANGATKGTVLSDTPNAPDDTRKFKKGDRIQIVPSAAFDTAGAINGVIRCNSTVPQA